MKQNKIDIAGFELSEKSEHSNITHKIMFYGLRIKCKIENTWMATVFSGTRNNAVHMKKSLINLMDKTTLDKYNILIEQLNGDKND